MGDLNVRPIKDKNDRLKMYSHALQDLRVFQKMWDERKFEEENIKVGAEQELCIVDNEFQPSKSGIQLLDSITDPHYTNELGLYNLEVNLDPEKLEYNCFSSIEEKLIYLLDRGRVAADRIGENILMAGILPTLTKEHLNFNYMTPIPRYKTLSEMLYNIRGGEFEIYIQGVDDLIDALGSVLFEACNTSFQVHLQIKPSEFVDKFNWAQMISGPVLSACVNSPMLFGRELWAETRIALFKQSLDTRNSKNHMRKKIPRVYFGNEWLRDSPINLWKNELIRFPLILTSDDLRNTEELYANGHTPDLRAIRLHNGTTYTWNRLCYGTGKKPHLRIECRYLPAGPSAIDEIANFAFWTGLMNNVPSEWNKKLESLQFKEVKNNFLMAARTGLNTVFDWFGEHISAQELILDKLLPLSKLGLESLNIDEQDIEKYLRVIQKRVEKEQTGSDWIVKSYRKNSKKQKANIANRALVSSMIDYQKDNVPVSEWKCQSFHRIYQSTKEKNNIRVKHLMATDLYSVSQETSLELIKSIFDWKKIRHLPIENNKGEVVGLITDGMISKAARTNPNAQFAEDLMLTDVIFANKEMEINEFKQYLKKINLKGLPVCYHKKLIGMITETDINNYEKYLSFSNGSTA